MGKAFILLVVLVAALTLGLLAFGGCGKSAPAETREPSTLSEETAVAPTSQSESVQEEGPGSEDETQPSATSPSEVPEASTPGPLSYPWDEMNMFFGWSIIGKSKVPYVKDLDMKWASLQPHIIWFNIEQERGKYDWSSLDNEIEWLQEMDVDITFIHSTFYNVYDEDIRGQIRGELLELLGQPGISTLEDAWITWNRDYHGPEKYGLVPDPFDENDATMENLFEFTRALTERYDGDGDSDWSGLKYPVRVHHIVEEWPNPGMDAKTYLGFLSRLSPVIKEADPNAKVMIPGLYMPNFGRIYAYLDGYIDDDDAGIVNGVKYSKSELSQMPAIKFGKMAYELILDLGRDYFDLVDIHLYTEKESFYEGEIEYVKSKMQEFGYQKTIWCVEGGGPFRNPESSPDDPQGDILFGTTDEKEVAEYVVKFHAMSAAKGLVRQHWGIGGQPQYGYWGGPWNIMGLLEKTTQKKRPAYYTYKIMREKLRDFEVGNVADLSIDHIRVFEFITPGGKVYVAWDSNGGEDSSFTDLTSVLGNREVTVTHIVTELNYNDSPVILGLKTHPAVAVPLSITPVFIE